MPVKARAFFSDELERAELTLDLCLLAKLYLIAREDVALDRAVNLDASGLNVAAALGARGEVQLPGRIDVPVERAGDVSDFRAGGSLGALARGAPALRTGALRRNPP